MARMCSIFLPLAVASLVLLSCVTTAKVKDPNVQPADLVGYTTWKKVNAQPLTGDPFNVLGQAHGGADAIGEIYINEAGRAVSTAGTGFPYPVGTVIVKETYERSATGGKGSVTQITAMVKRAPGYNPTEGDWEYILMKPDLSVGSRGQLSACMACHVAAADRDYVFNNDRTTVK